MADDRASTPSDMRELRETIERLYALPAAELPEEARDVFRALRKELSSGRLRSAEPRDDGWHVNAWVKKGILVGFRLGRIRDYSINDEFRFFDHDTLPPKRLRTEAGVRIVPGGSSIRAGTYVASSVICMPPMFINIGAYVGEGSMIDSHALVGSCAQVGRRVHVSAAAQLGGVLEPVGALPVIVEDDVLIGGGCGVYDGALIGRGAVLAAGVILTGSTPVFDLVHDRVLRREPDSQLAIPPGAVVVPGTRPASGPVAEREGLQLQTPIIVKYRDPGTDAATALEDALR